MLKSFLNHFKKLKFLYYAIITIGFSGLIDLFFTSTGGMISNEWISWIVSSLIVILIALLIDLSVYLYNRSRKQYADKTRQKINEYGSFFQIPIASNQTKPMFQIPQVEEEFIKSNHFPKGSAIRKERNRPVLYYSLSVKKYLNWIDYVFFNYLKMLKKELHCEVIIALHYNDQMRISIQTNHQNQLYYKSLREWYKNTIKNIIGSDTLIAYEDAFYRKYAKEYAKEYHRYYAYQVIDGAREFDNPSLEKEQVKKNFKRTLSNIESSFPIAQIAKRYTKSRQLYVLDRDKCLMDWQEKDILVKIKHKYPFIIITASTLTDQSGNKIDVHSEESVPNFTDSDKVLNEKFANLDDEVAELMFYLLNENLTKEKIYLPEKSKIKEELKTIYQEIIHEHNIVSFERKGENK